MRHSHHLVFVYGTLRKHDRNHHWLNRAKLVAEQCAAAGRLYDTGLGYPAVVPGGSSRVYGELYEVDDETLMALDELEGYDGPGGANHYERVKGIVDTDSGPMEAWMYVFQEHQATHLTDIESGDWKVYEHLRQGPWLYFAYGSCMDQERIAQAGMTGHFKQVGTGILHHYRLAFTLHYEDGSRADIVESQGDVVEGIVYEIDEEALNYLYVREGVHQKVYRPMFVDVLLNGQTQHVFTFTVIDKKPEIAPPEWYMHEIMRGAYGNVSEAYFEQLKKKAWHQFGMDIKQFQLK